MRESMRAAVLALCVSHAAAQVISTLLPGFRCTQQDANCVALADGYFGLGGTTGTGWRNATGWSTAAAGTPTDYCTFVGVTCTGGAITRIRLFKQRLNGTLPASFGAITTLTTLDLQNCPEPCRLSNSQYLGESALLAGTIPAAWASLSSLTALGISGNALTGTLPAWMAQLPNLRELGLNDNTLSGTIGLLAEGAPSLTYFNVQRNKFVGSIPSAIGRMTALVYLALNINLLSGTIPAELGQLTSLTLLGITKSRITGTLPTEMGKLQKMEYLAIGDNLLEGPLPASWSNMTNLWFAALYSNGLSGTLPPEWGGMSSLAYFMAHTNALRGTIPPSWGNLTALAALDMHDNQLYGDMPAALEAHALQVGLDPTVCATQPLVQSDYEYAAGFSAAGYSLPSDCPRRTCPADMYSADGLDTDGSIVGCIACPAGSGIADLGGISTPNVTAAHVGATSCTTATHAVIIGANALPACASGYHGTPQLLASGLWSGCDEIVDRRPTIIGAVIGSVLGACLLVACVVALRRRRAQPAALEGVRVSKDSSDQGSDTAPMVISRADVVLGECIGTGGFARVHLARWNGTAVAAKVFMQDKLTSLGGTRSGLLRGLDSLLGGTPSATSGGSGSLAAEMTLLASLRHPNICAVYGVVDQPSTWLLMELCSGGSLMALLRRSSLDSLSWAQRHNIGVGVASGVDFLHSQSPPVIHRDLKSANVVLTEALVPKLCDFGISAFLPALSASAAASKLSGIGTPRYMAPELILEGRYPGSAPQAIDVFGLGVVLHDLAHVGVKLLGASTPGGTPSDSSGGSLPPGSADTADSGATVTQWGALPVLMERYSAGFAVQAGAHCPPGHAALMMRCLAVNPAERPSARKALEELMALQAPHAGLEELIMAPQAQG